MTAVAHSHPVGEACKGSDYPVPWEKSWASEFSNFLRFGEGSTQAARRQQELGVSRQEGKTGVFLPGSLRFMKQEKIQTQVKSG